MARRVVRRRGQAMAPKRGPRAGTRGYANQSNPYVSRGMKRPTGLPSWTHNRNLSGTQQRPSPRTKFDEPQRRRAIAKRAGRPQISRRLKPYKRRDL